MRLQIFFYKDAGKPNLLISASLAEFPKARNIVIRKATIITCNIKNPVKIGLPYHEFSGISK
jgi:hypothetical protein